MFENLPQFSPDSILALIDKFKNDPRSKKIDFGVGVYKTNTGVTPVMRCVKAAEAYLARTQETKTYLGSGGNANFSGLALKLVFGDDIGARFGKRIVAFQSVGGTGALRLAADLLFAANPAAKIWIGAPTWPNHLAIFKKVGFETKAYPYCDPSAQRIDVGAIQDAAARVNIGDGFLIHACCHNPTGLDLEHGQLDDVLGTLQKSGAFPIVDCAYAGFAKGFEEDLYAARQVFDQFDEAIVCFSFSKNFGLYRERTGLIFVKSRDSQSAENVKLGLANIARANYSMPPDHGAAIVARILEDEVLSAQWKEELEQIRLSILRKRQRLADARINDPVLQGLSRQQGMFSLLPIDRDLVNALRDTYGIYMTADARINVLGVPDEMERYFVESLASVLGK